MKVVSGGGFCGVRTATVNRGVSLLEVLVSITLAMVILSSIWSLTTILNRRFESHLQIAESSQIVRSLHQQWTSDFNSLIRHEPIDSTITQFIPDEPREGLEIQNRFPVALPGLFIPPPMWNNFSNVPSDRSDEGSFENGFGYENTVPVFQGGPTQMTLIVFPNPIDLLLEQMERQQAEETSLQTGESSVSRRKGFKRIRYYPTPFNELEESEFDFRDSYDLSDDGVPALGSDDTIRFVLTREEADFEWGLFAGQEESGFGTTDDFPSARDFSSFNQSALETLPRSAKSSQQDSIAEVSEYRFAYFDGYVWRSTWNSEIERQLPQAIRVDFNLTKLPMKSNSITRESNSQRYSFDSAPAFDEPESLSGFNRAGMDDDSLAYDDSKRLDSSENLFEHSFLFGIGAIKNKRQPTNRSSDSLETESSTNSLLETPAELMDDDFIRDPNLWQGEE